MLFASSLAPPAAVAQGAADIALARELFREGSRSAKTGDWETARDRYQRSLQLKRAAITLYSLGIAQQNTGHLVESLESLRAYLAEPQSESSAAYEQPAREAIAQIEPRIAQVFIVIEPADLAGLGVTVDGQPVPPVALGRPRLCNPGTHQLAAAASGHPEKRTSFSVGEGGTARVSLELTPAPSVPPPPPNGDEPELTAPSVLIGVGGAVLITGVAVGLAALSQASGSTFQDDEDAEAARTQGIVGDVLAIAGGATAAVGVVWLLTELLGTDDAPPAEAQGRIRPWAAGDMAGIEIAF